MHPNNPGQPPFWAHTPAGGGHAQPMSDHLRAVAKMAQAFAAKFEAGELGYWAGMLHDLGKYTPEFQQYLQDCHSAKVSGTPPPQPGKAPHKQHGAAYAMRRNFVPLAFAILGHHGGLPKQSDARANGLDPDYAELESLFQTAVGDCPELANIPDLIPAFRRLVSDLREVELLIRMVYSCLVDADSLDTEAHTNPVSAALRKRPAPRLEELRETLVADQERLMARAENRSVNDYRREVYEACRAAGQLAPGVFKLTVPTGGGKTRSSLAFALEHAVSHGLERVIYAIPYTSIVDQTAEEFERIFGLDAVLEHHSAIEPPESDAEEAIHQHDLWRRLACQSWDAPLIVTTTVQLFESLFGNRTGRSRKVHRLAKSVIVLDEVQTLPPPLLKPLVDGLRGLCKRFGTTVLLCTATQPALDATTLASVGFTDVREIAPDPPRLFAELRRVEYDLSPLDRKDDWTWEQVAAAMREQPACLTVLNTRKDALAVLAALEDEEALHLSTLLCGRHRRDTLAKIRQRLKGGMPCRVVSTQVVECGCDLDFPLVLRVLGPLDRIVQAGGRCNREGKRSPDESRVVVFRPAEGGAPRGAYRVAMDTAKAHLRGGVDLHDPTVYERYFREVFGRVELDADKIQKLRADLDFPQVAEKLRLIQSDTVAVLVPYAEALSEYEAVLDLVQNSGGWIDRHLWRRAQPLMVSIYRWQFEQFQRRGLAVEVAPDFYRWMGSYHPVRGLTEDAADPTDLIA